MRRPFPFPIRLPGKIALRISLLSWPVALVALAIFAAAIVPEQKKDLLDALESKARGISSSLQDVTAGAAVSEDYSSVVDQCIQVLAGDQAIDYLVVTRNDGVSAIVERGSWRPEKLGPFWRPPVRAIASGIQVVPVFGRRVFHFSRSFDYSAIHWGWIHVGLSLSSYDRSVRRVYFRTAFLTILCIATSLVASVWYAQQLVKPILDLQSVVRQVTRGDLTARTIAHGQDEIGGLAAAFNAMADSILRRNRILESIRFAGQQFLTTADWRTAVPETVDRLGTAIGANSGAVFENRALPDGSERTVLYYSWVPAQIAEPLTADYLQTLQIRGLDLGDLAENLRRGEIVQLDYRRRKTVDGLEVPGRPPATILTPIKVGKEWFGFIGFDDCRERDWSEAEIDGLKTAAGMLGAIITRQRAQQAVLEATPNRLSPPNRTMQKCAAWWKTSLCRSWSRIVVRIRIRRAGGARVRVEIQDSGVGLPRESLTRIFAHGFTTKRDGHGFGLHSGALAANRMGGALWAESDGPGRGATFILELPLAPHKTRPKGVA